MKIIDIIKTTSQFREQQYKVKRVSVVDIKYLPRNKQLYVYGEALPLTGDKIYKIIIVFDKIYSSPVPDKIYKLRYVEKEGQPPIYLERPNDQTNIRVRCSCPDSYFSYQYWNKQKKSLIGPHKNYVRKTTTYPERNPRHLPGLCKHTLTLLEKLIKQGLVNSGTFVKGYLSRPKKDPYY